MHKNLHHFCCKTNYIPTYAELSVTGPREAYDAWHKLGEDSSQLHPNTPWFMNPSFDIAVLQSSSIIVIYMHLFAKFLATRFAKYCFENNCNGQGCLQDVGFQDIFKEYPVCTKSLLERYKFDLFECMWIESNKFLQQWKISF